MAIWGAIKNIFLSPSKRIDKIVDAGISAIDKIFYTKEEKEERKKQIGDEVIKFVQSQGEASTTRSRARRLLAILVVGHFLLFLDLTAMFYILNVPDKADKMLKLAGLLATASSLVVIFYFGYYGAQNIFKARGKT